MGTRAKERNEHIHKLARTVAGQLGVDHESWFRIEDWPKETVEEVVRKHGFAPEFNPLHTKSLSAGLLHCYGKKVRAHIASFNDEAIGKTAMCGMESHIAESRRQTSLATVRKDDLWTGAGGAQLVLDLATYAVIAAMTDNILADAYKEIEVERDNEQERLSLERNL